MRSKWDRMMARGRRLGRRMMTRLGAAVSIGLSLVLLTAGTVVASGGPGVNDGRVEAGDTTTTPPPPPPPPLLVTPATSEQAPPTTTLPQWPVRIAGYDGPGDLLFERAQGDPLAPLFVLSVPADPWLVPPAGMFAIGQSQFMAVRRGVVADVDLDVLQRGAQIEPAAVLVQSSGPSPRHWIEGRAVR